MSDVELSVVEDRLAEAMADALGTVRVHLRRAMNEAGRDLSTMAQVLAPRGPTGKLQKSLSKVQQVESTTKLTERVGPAAFYGRWLEAGVTNRTLTVRRAIGGASSRSFTYQRKHAIRARPFLAPTMDAMREGIRQQVLEALDRAAVEASNGY